METNHNQIVSLIWNIADNVLRDVFLLEPTKEEVKGVLDCSPMGRGLAIPSVLTEPTRRPISVLVQSDKIVAHADCADSGSRTARTGLKQHIEDGKRGIITTIQKFPFMCDVISDVSDHNFAIVIDEAHSRSRALLPIKNPQETVRSVSWDFKK